MTELQPLKTNSERQPRFKAKIPDRYQTEYAKYLPEIQAKFKAVEYWHGTGRFQHGKDGNTVDVLDQIIAAGGLMPQHDVFDRLTGPVHTISLAIQRPYAAVYAKGHLWEGETLGYEDLTQKEWWKNFGRRNIRITGKHELQKLMSGETFKWLFDQQRKPKSGKTLNQRFKPAQEWYGKIRIQSGPPINTLRESTGRIRSDIEGNYPMLIGVKDGAVTPAQTAKYIAVNEVRSREGITFEGLTHMEVPYLHMDETEEKLKAAGIQVPLIPIELGELYEAQFPIQAFLQDQSPFRN